MKSNHDLQPPQWAFWLLKRLCPEDLYETIEGDMIEKFQDDVEAFGPSRAKLTFAVNAFKFIRLAIESTKHHEEKSNTRIMVQHHLKSAFRHFSNNKVVALINIIGLSVALSVCLVTGIYLRNELTFDSYHEKSQRTYRVNMLWKEHGEEYPMYPTPMIMADVLSEELSGADHIVRAHPLSKVPVEVPLKDPFIQERVIITGPSFFDVFKTETVKGDPRKALSNSMTAVLTRSTALKFFDTEDVVGKTFKFRTNFLITVGAVVEDLPANTHLPATMFISHSEHPDFLSSPSENYFGPGKWGTMLGTETFITMNRDQAINSIDLQLRQIADKYINSDVALGESKCEFILSPLRDLHFDQKYGGGPWVNSMNKQWLAFFAIVAALVLIMACINFTNLTMASALGRVREVGIRKTSGANRFQLVGQFLTEAVVIVSISMILSVTIVSLMLPAVSALIETELSIKIWSVEFLIVISVAILIIVIIAGLYPSLIISKFGSISALTSNTQANPFSMGLKRFLVVVQVAVSSCMIASVLLVSMQVSFVRDQPLGFDKNNVIILGVPDASKVEVLSLELNKSALTSEFTFTNNPPSTSSHWWTPMSRLENDTERHALMTLWSDKSFFKMYDLNLLAGRLPAEADPTENEVVKTAVNETLLNKLGYGSPHEALGKHFHFGGLSGEAEIVGVVKNFNTLSLHQEIPPVMISQYSPWYSEVDIKIPAGTDVSHVIDKLASGWKKVFPDIPFEFRFLDDEVDASYKAEQRLGMLFGVLAFVAISISCLGLWGLATYAAQQRRKEVGIRKVLGATIKDVLVLLSRDLMLTVAIAFAISVPVSWFMVNSWLESFAFHIEIGWEPFAVTAAALVLLLIVSVMWHTVKAAVTNPTESLRGE